jgi:hypothetical protein
MYTAIMMYRTCFRCARELEATPENFHREKARPLGIAYECKKCHNSRKAGRDRRKERWSNLTPEQKEASRKRNLRWSRTLRGRAIYLKKAYMRIDACDLSVEEVLAFTQAPCVYCGTSEVNRGLDRINNDLPHIRGNVQTACTDCNIVRGDRFSVDEMMEIGKAIANIREARRK